MKLIYNNNEIKDLIHNVTAVNKLMYGNNVVYQRISTGVEEVLFHSLKSYDYITIWDACDWTSKVNSSYYVNEKNEHTLDAPTITTNRTPDGYYHVLIFNKMRIYYNIKSNISSFCYADIKKMYYDDNNNVATQQTIVNWKVDGKFDNVSNSKFTAKYVNTFNKGDVLDTGLGVTFTCTDKTSEYVELVTNEPVGIWGAQENIQIVIKSSKIALDTSIIQ